MVWCGARAFTRIDCERVRPAGPEITGRRWPVYHIPITDRCSSGQVKELQRKTTRRSSRAYPRAAGNPPPSVYDILLYNIMLYVYYYIRRVHLNTCMYNNNNNNKKKNTCVFLTVINSYCKRCVEYIRDREKDSIKTSASDIIIIYTLDWL